MAVSRRSLASLFSAVLAVPAIAEASPAVPVLLEAIPTVEPTAAAMFRIPFPFSPVVVTDGSMWMEAPSLWVEDTRIPLLADKALDSQMLLAENCTGAFHGVEFIIDADAKYYGHRLIHVTETQPTRIDQSDAIKQYILSRMFR